MAANRTNARASGSPTHAGLLDTLAVLRDVVLPTLAKGPLIRRRRVVGAAERFGLDDRAVKRLQAMRRKYGPGPLVLAIPFRRQAIILAPADVQAILEQTPEPFAAATMEKRSALNHFEPDVVLASHGSQRAKRRRLNECTLETGCTRHSLSDHIAIVADQEMAQVAADAGARGQLDWHMFLDGWYRMVRRIVLGDRARHDTELTDLLDRLRSRANFAFMRPKNRAQRDDLLVRLERYVGNGEPQSLAGRIKACTADPDEQPHHQLPQYLFAFDPGAMASFRTLALLATHPAIAAQVRSEIESASKERAPDLGHLKRCYLEALRLWPTTPAILRETTRTVTLGDRELESGTHITIFAPFFHRDDETMPQAHRMDPALWDRGEARPELGLVPFSAGPARCPAAQFVPLVASLAMRALLTRLHLELEEPERVPSERLPGTLDPYSLEFRAIAV